MAIRDRDLETLRSARDSVRAECNKRLDEALSRGNNDLARYWKASRQAASSRFQSDKRAIEKRGAGLTDENIADRQALSKMANARRKARRLAKKEARDKMSMGQVVTPLPSFVVRSKDGRYVCDKGKNLYKDIEKATRYNGTDTRGDTVRALVVNASGGVDDWCMLDDGDTMHTKKLAKTEKPTP